VHRVRDVYVQAGATEVVSATTPTFDWLQPTTWLPPAAVGRLLAVLVAVGSFLRLTIWMQARSFYIDEANLLRNYAERGYTELLRPLDYRQYAPPLFSSAVKAVTAHFGYGELASRFVPLVAGLGTLVVFAAIARRWLTPLGAGLATAFVAFGGIYLDLATVAKQYSSDALVALLLVWAAERQLRHFTFSGRAAGLWAAAGALLVWASMPAVFGLTGVGAALAWRFGRGREASIAQWARLGLVGATWGASFGAYFFLLLKTDAQGTGLQAYHADFFLAFPPRDAADWALLGEQLRGLADRAFGKTTLALGLALLGSLAGIRRLASTHPAHLFLLLLPLVGALAASALHYYSLLARLMFFAMPALVLLIMTGLEPAFGRRGLGIGVLAVVLAVLGNQQRVAPLFGDIFRTDFADVRAGLRYAQAHRQPDDLLFAYYLVAPVALHYQKLTPLRPPLQAVWLQPYRWLGADSIIVAADAQALAAAGHRRLWFVFDHQKPWVRRWAEATGRVTHDTVFYRGTAFCWEAR
jgi:hypothetical protein